ncbi:hypothetical protein Q3G72_023425 [Acer saccharum]|nr:hypothetical protein Q3G72_023425 [Acer saccharum]
MHVDLSADPRTTYGSPQPDSPWLDPIPDLGPADSDDEEDEDEDEEEESKSLSRDEASVWLQRIVGVVGDLEVVEVPSDSVIIPDGAALSAFQYFENVQNFLVAVEELGLPTFKASDFEQVVESMLIEVMEEFEHRLASQNEQMKAAPIDVAVSVPNNSLTRSSSGNVVMEDEFPTNGKMEVNTVECDDQNYYHGEESKTQLLKRQMLVELQQRNILELKQTLHIMKEGMQLLQIKYQEEFNNFGKHLHSLASAASGYQRVLEENRKLYNQVQELKGNIRVYCRVRPFLNRQPNLVTTVDSIEEGNIVITIPSKYGKELRRLFSFNKVFGPAATQVAVFQDTQALIRSVLDGFNVCIFAYGQTGSGKTFTMTGPNELTEESLGVNYRALSDLFVLANQRKDTISYDISVQMLEIYNEQVRDLLVTDANLVPVSSTSDVINLMNLGHKNSAVSSTAMNDRSSQSQSCLTVHVQGRNLTSGGILCGSMHLLAGSERVDKSEVTGDRLKEAQHINKSLAALGDVIASLAQKSTHVPYRNSKLTQLLQDSLGGQAKTLMFVHISPEPDALGETLSTLKFAERVATVELGVARVNKDGSDVKVLKDQIASLKAALARKDGESEHLQFARPSTPDRLKMKSGSSYPSNSSSQSVGDVSSNRRQPMEEVGNTQVRKQSAIKPRRKSLDPRDLLVSSPPWPTVGIPVLNRKEEDRVSVSGDWVDKNYPRNPSKIYLEQTMNSLIPSRRGDSQDYDVIQRSRSEVASTTDDSDHEAATSDCSEPDSLLHFNIQKLPASPVG